MALGSDLHFAVAILESPLDARVVFLRQKLVPDIMPQISRRMLPKRSSHSPCRNGDGTPEILQSMVELTVTLRSSARSCRKGSAAWSSQTLLLDCHESLAMLRSGCRCMPLLF